MNKSTLVIAALLVATAAAAGPLDILARFGREQQEENVFIRRLLGNPLERSLIYGESLRVPSYLRDEIFDVNVIQIENLILHPLFPVYMGLPYFQQYWSYPMFQRYVCSQYFQRFWELPAFQQYFVNPALFYKYIYPLVTIFKYDSPLPYNGVPYSAQYYPGYPFQQYQQRQQHQVPLSVEIYYRNLLEKTNSNLENSQQAQLSTEVKVTPEVVTVKQEVVAEPTITTESVIVENDSVQPVTDDAKLNDDQTPAIIDTIEDDVSDEDEEDEIASSTTPIAASIPSPTVLPKQQVVINPNPYIYNNNNYPSRRYQFNPLANMFPRYYY